MTDGWYDRWYQCMICGGRWTQYDGRDPQRHVKGCPNAQPGDQLFALANDVIREHPIAGKPISIRGAS